MLFAMNEPRWKERFRIRTVDARKALSIVRRGSRVFVGSGCAEPVRETNAAGVIVFFAEAKCCSESRL